MQAKFLRVVEYGEFRRVGDTRPTKVNVRIIAATNKKLANNPEFRQDLYSRLSAVEIHIPPLRERKEDILPTAEFYTDRLNALYGKKKELSSSLVPLLQSYDFPSNVRELINILTSGFVMSDDSVIGHNVLLANTTYKEAELTNGSVMDYRLAMRQFRERVVVDALKASQGNTRVAAKMLNISYRQLNHTIKTFGYGSAYAFYDAHDIPVKN